MGLLGWSFYTNLSVINRPYLIHLTHQRVMHRHNAQGIYVLPTWTVFHETGFQQGMYMTIFDFRRSFLRFCRFLALNETVMVTAKTKMETIKKRKRKRNCASKTKNEISKYRFRRISTVFCIWCRSQPSPACALCSHPASATQRSVLARCGNRYPNTRKVYPICILV
jgi:hypothetical protein